MVCRESFRISEERGRRSRGSCCHSRVPIYVPDFCRLGRMPRATIFFIHTYLCTDSRLSLSVGVVYSEGWSNLSE